MSPSRASWFFYHVSMHLGSRFLLLSCFWITLSAREESEVELRLCTGISSPILAFSNDHKWAIHIPQNTLIILFWIHVYGVSVFFPQQSWDLSLVCNDPFVPLMNTHTYVLVCKMKTGFLLFSEDKFNYKNKTGFLVAFF